MRKLSVCLVLALTACGTSSPAPQAAPPAAAAAPADTPPSRPATHFDTITFARTECYGKCPAYEVTIHGDGSVAWQGERYVKVVGKAEAQLTPAQTGELERAFTEAGFLDLDKTYTHDDMTDMPSATTSYAHGGQVKTVEHYYGDRHAPAKLTRLEQRIDEIVGSERWIK